MKKAIASKLLEIEAVSLRPNNPFTWSSGIKSPIYCDNRLTMSYPVVRRQLAEGLANLIKEHYGEVDVIAGTATAGIPHAAWVSEQLGLPMVYVRSKAKGHGKGNQIEGKVIEGQKVVIIEDLISTGGSVINAAQALREVGANVLGVAAIFTYELEKGTKQLEEANVIWHTLTDFSTLAKVSVEQGHTDQEDIQSLTKWKQDPEKWIVEVK
ncbi:orotate phosphoribosyltransferase [Salirhabdus salicampi]|uniref:orotate phosphoribosyltransferase n=1 Tax=Salirhabdus salicampi TaxID=476102 RepID=UPI0020C3C124|nr:orotate phosphoribosyltransferase [Salirhabdus salicampi]MCP8615967.1 orotate phosphoribosyltransferase [Salirhabdus salicampi]